MRRYAGLAAALALGVIMVAGFAPLNWWWLPLLTLAGLVHLWQGAESQAGPGRAAALGFAFGLGWFCTGISWVYVSMHDYGGMPLPLAGAATLLFAAYLALFPAMAGWLQARLLAPRERAAWWYAALITGAAWAFSEWVRGWLFTGFPWIATGYAHTDGPLAGYAPVLGIHGLNFLSGALAALLARAAAVLLARQAPLLAAWQAPLLAARQARRALVAPALAVAVIIALGAGLRQVAWTEPTGRPVTVSLLQGNVPQDLKFVPGRFESTLAEYQRLIEANPAELIVLPETALPRMIQQIPDDYLRHLAGFARAHQGNIVVGVPTAESREDYYNSAISIGSNAVQQYDKSHLVPFGEFIPFGFRWFVDMMQIPLGDFSRRAHIQAPLQLGELRAAVNICYEDLFGDEIIRPLPQANLLINISNIAWFGASLAPHQHLQISRMRALETGRYMLRATNTGATAVIDAQGRVTAQLAPFTVGALVSTAQAYSGATPYVRFGDWPAVLLSLALLAWGARRAWRARQAAPPG